MIEIGKIIEDILIKSLGTNTSEKGLIFCDDFDGDGKLKERIRIVNEFVATAKRLGIELTEKFIKNSGANGLEPEIGLWKEVFDEDFIDKIDKKYGWDSLKNKIISIDEIAEITEKKHLNNLPDFVIALSYFSTSHTYFRKLLNRFDTRYISMPLFDLRMFEGPLNIDFGTLEKDTKELWNKVYGKKKCLVKTDTGTNLSFEFGDRVFKSDTGNFRSKGSFGNLPAGEVYIAPIEDKTEGTLVIEWTMEGRLENPLIAVIEKGRVTNMEGDSKLKSFLKEVFRKDERNNCICELGFGTNKCAKRPDNILEAEKIYGTAHIAFGDNITFGGNNKASTHIDYVIFNPEIEWH